MDKKQTIFLMKLGKFWTGFRQEPMVSCVSLDLFTWIKPFQVMLCLEFYELTKLCPDLIRKSIVSKS